MQRKKLAVWLSVLALAVSCRTQALAAPAAEPRPEAGDLVFETSTSPQSAAIQWATRSPWSHVGIVEVAADGTFVIEALGKVSRTPWRAWRRRALRGGDLLVLRPRGLSAEERGRAVARARAFLGKPYDPRFGWGDDRIYCSELVVKAYERGAGISLGKRERLGDLRLAGVERAAEKRWGGKLPRDLVLVTPASLAGDARLERVYEGRP
ncbi:MAG TPA: YiiX/YebB-like N1pC/P60 family cysteine hydrolase [Anaeromyxobacter sp.]